MNDLRTPIGLFFVLLAVLVMTVPLARARIDAGPVNLYSGAAMLVFGAVMLALGRRAGRR
jgi:hypothetical protein